MNAEPIYLEINLNELNAIRQWHIKSLYVTVINSHKI